MAIGPGEPSRIRQYADGVARINKDMRVGELEEELELEKRRYLRLSQQLIEETALRARAERTSREVEQELETVKAELEKANERTRRNPRASQSRKRVGDGGTVSDSVQRVDGGTPPKRKSRAKPADVSGDASQAGPAKRASSSRKRGNVK